MTKEFNWDEVEARVHAQLETMAPYTTMSDLTRALFSLLDGEEWYATEKPLANYWPMLTVIVPKPYYRVTQALLDIMLPAFVHRRVVPYRPRAIDISTGDART